MKFSFKWLNDYFNNDLKVSDIEHKLTMAGLEVESVKDLSNSLDNVVVGEIINLKKHPDADKLNICEVSIGNEILQIVCGAPNAKVGIKVPCALIGAKFGDFTINKAKLRGIDSYGMLCSAKEIGVSDDTNGLLVLNQELINGSSIVESLGLNDYIFDVSLTPNRADCLSIQGIAREVRAFNGNRFSTPKLTPIESRKSSGLNVHVENNIACPVYCYAEVININNNITLPSFITHRLNCADIGSISPIVDLINYVMLECGQPMHAFDSNKIKGNVVVRGAKVDEKIKLLNDQVIDLDAGDLIIADEHNPLALAGVMGGEDASVNPDTKNIFIEAAFFSPLAMAGTARKYSLNTDSSHRFERGVDFNETKNSLVRVLNLIKEYCGGEINQLETIVGELPNRNLIKLNPKKIEKILGSSVAVPVIEEIIKNLGFDYKLINNSEFEVTSPSYRFDIAIEEDLVEEIIRVVGYDNVDAVLPKATLSPMKCQFKEYSINDVRYRMSLLGYNELVSYSFIDEEAEKKVNNNQVLIKLNNPIAENMNTMRSHLWASHLDALKFNLNRKQNKVKFFEISKVFKKGSENFIEKNVLSALLCGESVEKNWIENSRKYDFFDAKADIEKVIQRSISFKEPAKSLTVFHPGQAAEIFLDGHVIGNLGMLHPSIQKENDIANPVFLFEIDVKNTFRKTSEVNAQSLKTIPIQRDIAIIVDQSTQAGQVIDLIKSKNIPYVRNVELFDVYQGDGIEKSKKSLAFLILMQDTYKTLEEEDVDNSMQIILKLLNKELSAELR
jgi:phenylalanyl-tRNA synthetase beta chain